MTEATLWTLSLDAAAVTFRAFELYPDGGSAGTSRFGDAEWNELQRLAVDAGVRIRARRTLPKTRKAHEAARFARERGSEVHLRRAIFAAIWEDGRDVGRIDVLTDLAESVGLDGEDLRIALDIDRYEADVEADQELARRLHVPGTPIVYIGTGPSARVIAGAHAADVLRSEVTSVERKQNRIDHV